jgi:DNA-directed RNA polymerase sigma subunit (sigma70/sigma32)
MDKYMKGTQQKVSRNEKIYVLRMAGLTLEKIGKHFKISRQRVHEIFLAEVKRREKASKKQ